MIDLLAGEICFSLLLISPFRVHVSFPVIGDTFETQSSEQPVVWRHHQTQGRADAPCPGMCLTGSVLLLSGCDSWS